MNLYDWSNSQMVNFLNKELERYQTHTTWCGFQFWLNSWEKHRNSRQLMHMPCALAAGQPGCRQSRNHQSWRVTTWTELTRGRVPEEGGPEGPVQGVVDVVDRGREKNPLRKFFFLNPWEKWKLCCKVRLSNSVENRICELLRNICVNEQMTRKKFCTVLMFHNKNWKSTPLLCFLKKLKEL